MYNCAARCVCARVFEKFAQSRRWTENQEEEEQEQVEEAN